MDKTKLFTLNEAGCFYNARKYCQKHKNDDPAIVEEILKTGTIPAGTIVQQGALCRASDENVVDFFCEQQCAVYIYVHNHYYNKKCDHLIAKIPKDDTLVYFYYWRYQSSQDMFSAMTLVSFSNIYAFCYIGGYYLYNKRIADHIHANEIAAGYDVPEAMVKIGYRLIFMTKKDDNDIAHGLELLKKAAELGHTPGYRLLGLYYYNTDKELGLSYLRKAVGEIGDSSQCNFHNLEYIKKIFSAGKLSDCDPISAFVLANEEPGTDNEIKYFNLLYVLFSGLYFDLTLCHTAYFHKNVEHHCNSTIIVEEIVRFAKRIRAKKQEELKVLELESLGRLKSPNRAILRIEDMTKIAKVRSDAALYEKNFYYAVVLASMRGGSKIVADILKEEFDNNNGDKPKFYSMLMKLIEYGIHARHFTLYIHDLISYLFANKKQATLYTHKAFIKEGLEYYTKHNLKAAVSNLVYLCSASKGVIAADVYKQYIAEAVDYCLKAGPLYYKLAKVLCEDGVKLGIEHCKLRMELIKFTAT